MLIGDKIKSIRELKKYTQKYVADQLDMTQGGYSKIEKGTRNLSIKKLEQLARVLGVPVENIINFESSNYFIENKTPKRNDAYNHISVDIIKTLYEDKIELLEKLLTKTNRELQFYKEKCGFM